MSANGMLQRGETFSRRLIIFVALLYCIFPVVSGGQSKLKVAACKPGQAPYVVVQEDGNLAGFDVGECPLKPLKDNVSYFLIFNIKSEEISQIYGTKPTAFSSNEYRRR
jgi:hypothetical protein